MATLNAIYDLQLSSSLRNRFGVAVQIAALAVFAEDPGTPAHAERVVLATKVLTSTGDSTRYGEMFHRVSVLTTTSVQTEAATDAQIQAAVEGLFTAVAVVGL